MENVERARKQIDTVFNRYSDPLSPLCTSPMWQLLLRMRQRLQPPHSHVQNSDDSSTLQQALLTDDLMLDFGMGQNQDMTLFDGDFGLQQVEDLPWYVTQDS